SSEMASCAGPPPPFLLGTVIDYTGSCNYKGAQYLLTFVGEYDTTGLAWAQQYIGPGNVALAVQSSSDGSWGVENDTLFWLPDAQVLSQTCSPQFNLIAVLTNSADPSRFCTGTLTISFSAIPCPSWWFGPKLIIPTIGAPTRCCQKCGSSQCRSDCGGNCGDKRDPACGTQCAESGPCGAKGQCCKEQFVPPHRVLVEFSDCQAQWKVTCPPGTTPHFSRNALSDMTNMLDRWQQEMSPRIPQAGGPGSVVLPNGNLFLTLTPPRSGAFDPPPLLVYNSQSSAVSEFGAGWMAAPKQTLTSISSDIVVVTKAGGKVTPFSRVSGSNSYQSPGENLDTLVFNATDSSWLQTAPSGFQYHYVSSGEADRMSDQAGNRWTMSYDGGGR